MRTLSQQETEQKLIALFRYNAETGLIWRQKSGKIVGAKTAKGYLIVSFNYKFYYCHRLAWFLHFGVWPVNELDHINRVKDDNRLVNLREATRQENACNRNTQINNSSGHTGISWATRDSVWRAYIQANGYVLHLGSFKTKEEAILARNKRLGEIHGEFANAD